MIKVPTPRMRWWERIYLVEVGRGMIVTMGHLVRNIFVQKRIYTHQWPEEPKPIFPRLKGRHRLTRRPDGTPKCTACYCCQTVCPPNAIDIVAEESDDPKVEKQPGSFRINMTRCIFCGMCVEACPKDAIVMTADYELADQTRERLQLGLHDLLEPAGKTEER